MISINNTLTIDQLKEIYSPLVIPGQRKFVKEVNSFSEEIVQLTYEFFLAPGSVAIDCGANVGRHTVGMSKLVGNTGRVLAIEANPEVSNLLVSTLNEKNIENVSVLQCAVTSSDGHFADFDMVTEYHEASSLKLRPEKQGLNKKKVKVKTRTLNSIVAEHGLQDIRFVKVDVEGAEYDALRGGSEVFEKNAIIVFEHSGQAGCDLFNYSHDDFYNLFEDAAYLVYDWFGNQLNRDTWYKLHPMPWNRVAIPESIFPQFREYIHILGDIWCNKFPILKNVL